MEGLILGGAYLKREIWVSKSIGLTLFFGGKFTVFALFYFVFGSNFPSTSPRGAYIWRGDLTEGFLRYRFGGLIFGRAYQGLIFGILRYGHRFIVLDHHYGRRDVMWKRSIFRLFTLSCPMSCAIQESEVTSITEPPLPISIEVAYTACLPLTF